MQKSVLLQNRDLILTLVVDEGEDHAQITIQSTKNGPDLGYPDDVVVVLDGTRIPTRIESSSLVVAEIEEAWSALSGRGFNLMIRVEEFFEGWEFEAEP